MFLAFEGMAQTVDLTAFNQERLRKQRIGMLVLGGWAVGNMVLGTSLMNSKSGSERYFHMMNAGWNVVNLGLATAGYISAIKADPASFDFQATVAAQQSFQKILLFNAGLDVGYMLGGLYLIERSKNTENNPERLKGFGQSIILQGGFLFAFDLVNYFIHQSADQQLAPLFGQLFFNGSSIGISFQF